MIFIISNSNFKRKEIQSTVLRKLLKRDYTQVLYKLHNNVIWKLQRYTPKRNISEWKIHKKYKYCSMFNLHRNLERGKVLTRFMTSVRSPDSSSSGVGGSGRLGAPPTRLDKTRMLNQSRSVSLVVLLQSSYLLAYLRDENFGHYVKTTTMNRTTVWKEKIQDCSSRNRDYSGTTWQRMKHT